MLKNERTPTDQDIADIQRLIDVFTLAVFQRLNKTFNAKKMRISISSLKENN